MSKCISSHGEYDEHELEPDAFICSWCFNYDLNAVRRIAWDEGFVSGHSTAMRIMSDEPDAPRAENPYGNEATK